MGLSLDALRPKVQPVSIVMPDGETLTVKMSELTRIQSLEIEEAIPYPADILIPKLVNGVKEMIVDREATANARVEVNIRRINRKLGTMLQGGGSFDDLEGLSMDELERKVEEFSEGVINALYSAYRTIQGGVSAQIQARADTFPGE